MNDTTDENVIENYNFLKDKTVALYQETLDKKSIFKRKLRELLILEGIDPFYIGRQNDIIQAEWARDLWQEYVDTTGLDSVHTRGLHYFIVMLDRTVPPAQLINPRDVCRWSSYENTTNCYQYLSKCLTYARYLGLIPFNGILDEKNDVTTIYEYFDHNSDFDSESSIKELIDFPKGYDFDFILPSVYRQYDNVDDYIDGVSEDYAHQLVNGTGLGAGIYFQHDLVKPFYIEIWSEKTLPSFIHDIFKQYKVNRVVEGGELSLSVMDNFIKEVNKRKQDGVALYFSDFDPKGSEMAVNMARKIQWEQHTGLLDGDINVYINPVALSSKQIIGSKLPLMPIKISDKKAYATLQKKFQDVNNVVGFAELQVLEARPDLYRQIVREAIKPWVCNEAEIYREEQRVKEDLKEQITALVKDELENHRDEIQTKYKELDRLADEMESLLPEEDSIREAYDEAKEKLPEIEQHSVREILDEIQDIIDLPDFEDPKIKRDPPVECLFDSRRDEQLQFNILYDSKISKKKKT